MKRDYLNGTPYAIEQPQQMYHFSSDTELLGRFMRLKKTDTVLDIGCNTGALLCYAAMQGPKALYGIDLFEDVIMQSAKNLKDNQITAELAVSRLQEYDPPLKFSVIVCNPPYFKTIEDRLKNENKYLASARHESFLNLQELFSNADRLLAKDGAFYLIHRSNRIPEILQCAQTYGLYPVRMRILYKTMHREASGVLFCFCHGSKRGLICDPPVFLDDRTTFADQKGEGR
ncbi:MAG: methyltransferase [Solobacterium sp.]|jgi:tRNA1(Val) A37 N6-methylase TrmN6|nr:methyltransferase [Solobacterium sp.]MCH4205656.1 methyltransferase [Solobacterium sp.]MCH4227151.1 methyltransferase [Solobacterium sp.]MCH4282486.1 methyltransferase [Solobacterium sp.]